jgi:hypothetical protein
VESENENQNHNDALEPVGLERPNVRVRLGGGGMISALLRPAAVLLLVAGSALGAGVRATPVRDGALYVAPDPSSTKLADLGRGRELVVLATSGNWVQVEATLSVTSTIDRERTVTGWIEDKGIVRATTDNGDKIVFGEAVDSEDQASRPNGRNEAAQDAMRLYARVAEYFPNSPLAGEALYRSADIRWQIDKADVMSRPSAKEQDAYLRQGMDEQYMRGVIKKFPGTKWADLAAFALLDNKLCGDWQAASKCPDKEAELYEKYVNEHPQSVKVAEALYDAAYRRSALIEIYKNEDQSKKSQESKVKATALAEKVVTQFSTTDWAARAERLLFSLAEDMPTYGNAP